MRHALHLEVPEWPALESQAPDLNREVALAGIAEVDVVRVLKLVIPAAVVLVLLLVAAGFRAVAQPKPMPKPSRVDITLDPDAIFLPPKHTYGNPMGNNALDPELLKAPQRHLPKVSPRLPSDQPMDLSKAQASDANLDPRLPLAAGGNGLAHGDGGLSTERVEPIRQVTVANQSLTGVSVEVRMVIDAEGVPIEATPISGPVELHARVRQAALQWRFRVPPSWKSRAPFLYTLTFHMW